MLEPRRGIREEEKGFGGRAGQYATGWSHKAHLCRLIEEKDYKQAPKRRVASL